MTLAGFALTVGTGRNSCPYIVLVFISVHSNKGNFLKTRWFASNVPTTLFLLPYLVFTFITFFAPYSFHKIFPPNSAHLHHSPYKTLLPQ